MFYDNQPKEKQEAYKEMLIILGSLSRLFSTAEEPYLYYRAHENILQNILKLKIIVETMTLLMHVIYGMA